MAQPEQLLLSYLHLARASQVRRQLFVRDKFLVLSGVTASELGWNEIAADCRERVLLHNPRHLIRRWPDLERAARAERFETYFKQLRRKYSAEKAEHMLQSLGIPLVVPADELRDSRGRAALLVAALSKESSRRKPPPLAEGNRAAEIAPAVPGPIVAGPEVTGPFEKVTDSWWPFWLGLLTLAVLGVCSMLRGPSR